MIQIRHLKAVFENWPMLSKRYTCARPKGVLPPRLWLLQRDSERASPRPKIFRQAEVRMKPLLGGQVLHFNENWGTSNLKAVKLVSNLDSFLFEDTAIG